jgi:hypothetical protein
LSSYKTIVVIQPSAFDNFSQQPSSPEMPPATLFDPSIVTEVTTWR